MNVTKAAVMEFTDKEIEDKVNELVSRIENILSMSSKGIREYHVYVRDFVHSKVQLRVERLYKAAGWRSVDFDYDASYGQTVVKLKQCT